MAINREIESESRMVEIISENWARENIVWLAGYLEGEGCFFFRHYPRKGSYDVDAIRIEAASTDEDVLKKVKFIVGDGGICGPYLKGKWKPIYQYSLRKKEIVYALCCALFPFMGGRRKQAIRDLIKFFASSCPQGKKRAPLNHKIWNFSEEGKKRISMAHKGKPLSIDHRKKISDALRGVTCNQISGGILVHV